MFEIADLSDLDDFGIGHAQNLEWITGCTVIYAKGGAVCSVDVRGGSPATRETDLLKPENAVQQVNAVCLSGGSAYGLEAACGVMECLNKNGEGFQAGPFNVPIVPGASLFDLPIGQPKWPDKQMGFEACSAAIEAQRTNDATVAQGNFGAGTGATIGKLGDPKFHMKGGFGYSGLRLGEIVVISCVAVNARGNILAEDSSQLAGFMGAEGRVLDPIETIIAQTKMTNPFEDLNKPTVENTTLGCVITNANLTKAQCLKVSQITQDAYGRAIKPVHTSHDGDAIFTMASGRIEADADLVGLIATEAMEQAIRNAVVNAKSLGGFKGFASK
jgi:L-aminopeptidase/D-esterase-like protein